MLSGSWIRIHALLGVAVLGSAGLTTPVIAQQTDIAAIQKRYLELYQGGNHAAALVEAQRLEEAVRAR